MQGFFTIVLSRFFGLRLIWHFLSSSETSEDTSVRSTELEKPFLQAISSALVVGTLLGVKQTFMLSFLVGPVLTIMEVGLVSSLSQLALNGNMKHTYGIIYYLVAFNSDNICMLKQYFLRMRHGCLLSLQIPMHFNFWCLITLAHIKCM